MSEPRTVGTVQPPAASGAFWPRAVKFGLGVAITLALLGWILSRANLTGMASSLKAVSWTALGVAALMIACGYGAKIARWHVMLVSIAPGVTLATSAQTLLASVALNNVLPLRAGDAARVFAFRDEIGAPGASILPLMVLERLLDTAMLVALAAAITLPMQRSGVLPDSLAYLPVLSGLALLGLVVAGLAAHPLATFLLRRGDQSLARVPQSLRAPLTQALTVLATQFRGRQAAILVALTAVAWGFEGAMLAALAAGFGFHNPILSGYFACALATLATLVPSAPGFFGTFHAAAIGAVSLFGAKADAAAAFAFLAHGLLWLPLTTCGLACLAWLSAFKFRHTQTGTP